MFLPCSFIQSSSSSLMLHAFPRRLLRRSLCTVSQSHHKFPTVQTNAVDAFDLLLQQSSTVHQTTQLHAQLILSGLHNSSCFLSARLISIYSSFNLLSEARLIFSTFPLQENPNNLLLWNSILRANLSHGSFVEAINLYVRMRVLGVCPDGFSFPLIIRACALILDLKHCRIIHGHVLQMGFRHHLHICNELVGLYAKKGRMDIARQLFDKMPGRNVLSWNILISGYAANFDCDGALQMFREMEVEDGVQPNLVTWTSLLSAHARCDQGEDVLGFFMEMRRRGIGATAEAVAVVLSVCTDMDSLDKGKEIHAYVVKSGLEDYVFVKNSLICIYGKHGLGEDAKVLFSEVKVKNLVTWNALISSFAAAGLCDEAFGVFLQLENLGTESIIRPNVVSWSAVISGFASEGRGDEALELFRQMRCLGVEPNSVTMASVLSVCAEIASLRLGREVHGHLIRSLMVKNIVVGNGLLHMYAKCGSLRYARLVFEQIESRDLISWNSMIAGYGMHGFGEEAVSTYKQMVKAGYKADGITFVTLLSACSHAGLVAEGCRLFDQMKSEYMLSPQLEHYACMVDLLGRAGFLQEASEYVKMMPMKPNACVWGALLNSCRIYKNTAAAEETAFNIFGIESGMTGSYMLLSNIYAACGRWEDSAKVRVLTKTKGLKKSLGCSWIEVKKKIYMFSAGSPLQPGLEEVYGILRDLSLQMEADGYIPDKNFVLQDVDKEEKKQVCMGT